MRIKSQVAMVMHLDKCIGCNTCSVTCKTTWTNRTGAEHMWFQNVETKPGIGYPRRWEDQEHYRGGWTLKHGRLQLLAGSPGWKLLNIFYNPDMPSIDDFYAPWTYNYDHLTGAGPQKHQPVARPLSQLSGRAINAPKWGPNWDDDLAGTTEYAARDMNLCGLEEQVTMAFERAFMLYLPRICEHCLNPSCVASCPSAAIYKREEDGIVLVDQEDCRGWRYCVSGCPYKKTYFNWRTFKAEKCTFCYPRIEAGLPTVCSETCVGRIRTMGVLLYDADRIEDAASTEDPKKLVAAHRTLFLDPNDPKVIAEARQAGINDAWIAAAQKSPVYKLAVEWGLALPPHPEYRTLPMVWYVPPLSPVMHLLETDGDFTADKVFAVLDQMRIPMQYLANLLSAGDVSVVREVLAKLVAMRAIMRARTVGYAEDPELLRRTGLTSHAVTEMARLLSIAKYDERNVIPTARREGTGNMQDMQGGVSLDELLPPKGAYDYQRRPE